MIYFMFLRPKKNRRRVDVAKKTQELKAAARSHAPTFLKVFGLLVLSGGLFVGAWQGWLWLTTTERFALSGIGVSGASRATDTELVRLTAVPLGTNLFTIDLKAVERSLASHPWVRSAKVHRQLPSRLSIEVVEHTPVALLALGELYLVNEDGAPFKRVTGSGADAMDLPLITGIDRDDFSAHHEETLGQLRRAVDVAQTYAASNASKAASLSEVHLSPDGVSVVTTAGQEIRFADGDLGPSLERLERIRAELKARSLTAEVIRLDNRARPHWVTVQLSSVTSEKTDQSRK